MTSSALPHTLMLDQGQYVRIGRPNIFALSGNTSQFNAGLYLNVTQVTMYIDGESESQRHFVVEVAVLTFCLGELILPALSICDQSTHIT